MNKLHFFYTFTKEERVRGAEEFLSSGITYGTHDELVDDRTYLVVEGHSMETDRFGRDKRIDTKLWIRQQGKELYKTFCSCGDFRKDHFGCKHICGLMAGYLMKEYGRDVFKGTVLEEELIERTGIETPFLEGILRKSDRRIGNLLKEKTTLELPKWNSQRIQTQRCGIDMILEPVEGGIWVDLKVGDKKKYVVKNIAEFLEAYENREQYCVGKSTIRMYPDMFSHTERIIIEFLLSLYKANGEMKNCLRLFPERGVKAYRYLFLTAKNLETFMEYISEHGFMIQGMGNRRYYLETEDKKLPINVNKNTYGIDITMNPFYVLAEGVDYIYVYDKNSAYRLTKEDSYASDLIHSLSANEDVYIGESDVKIFCQSMLPALMNHFDVSVKNMDSLTYRAEIPDFEFYLDMPQHDMISCKTKVIYPIQDKQCQLFDQESGEIIRNAVEESKVARNISYMFQAFDEAAGMLVVQGSDDQIYEFLKVSIPQLQEMGAVLISDVLKKKNIQNLPAIKLGVQVNQNSLVMSLTSSEMGSKELSQILSAYNRKKKYHRLKDGTFISFEGTKFEEWEAISQMYQSHGLKDPENMKVPLYRLLYLDEKLRERESIVIERNDRYYELLRNMTEDVSDCEVPETLKSILREYQRNGFYWICKLKRCGFGGILADDMGLGKTIQILTFLLHEKRKGLSGSDMRTLIVTPASLVYNWAKEMKTFTPELTYKVIAGNLNERRAFLEQFEEKDADVWITSYDLLKRDIELYKDIHFANQIIDEAQYIKNHNTQVSQSVRLIDSGFRMALTGTPIENRLSELWSIFDYLMPGFLFGYTKFRGMFEVPIVVEKDEDALSNLRSLVHPFILRRLKKDVLKDLPDKIEETITVQLEGEQKKLYDAHAKRLKLYLDDKSPEAFRQNKLEVLAELTKLRQLCCAPEMLFDNYKAENAKIEVCLQLLHQAIEGGHKVLLFSQFTSMLDLICKRLDKEKIKYHRIDGSTKKEDRMEMVACFQEDDVPVFCISLKAGGTGLNLTAADIVIHYDPWWNKAAQNQATDRAHRIGQEEVVTVYQLIAEETIEERIKDLQAAKAELADDLLSGESIGSILIQKEDVLKLLG